MKTAGWHNFSEVFRKVRRYISQLALSISNIHCKKEYLPEEKTQNILKTIASNNESNHQSFRY